MIVIKDLKKHFKKLNVLEGIDLTIEDGKVLGIIGSSGSGKSTLLRCIDYLETPDSGHISFDDVDKVGLLDRADHYPSQLSGGQQQRVAIARALALNPKVILFDEPTSALDPEMIQEVLKVIQRVANEGKTMVIVSHEMNFIYDICDKVVFLDNGKILAEGTPREVMIDTKNERIKQFVSKVNFIDQYVI